MDETYNESTPNRPEGDRFIDAPVVAADLNDLIHQLENETAWQKNDRNAITVFKTGKMRVVLTTMHENSDTPEQTIDGIVSMQVINGHLKIKTNNEERDVKTGQMLVMHNNISYSIRAEIKSTFLLTIAGFEKND